MLLLLVDADVVLTTVATIVTSFRLCIRARQKRLWIDDAWAALGMIFNSSLLVAVCLYTQDYSEHLHGVYVAYIVLKKRRDISSRHKDSIILHVCSLFFLYLGHVTNTISGWPNFFMQLYGKILML
jgi:hypothetical protein